MTYQQEYYKKNRAKVDARTSAYYRDNVDKYLLMIARKRAKKYGVNFDLKQEDIVVPEYCPVLGIKLERGEGRMQKASPSLDKIDPLKGYTKDNVQVISLRANAMKQNATPEELHKFADWVKANVPLEVSDG